jgi:serine/threonine protein kinase
VTEEESALLEVFAAASDDPPTLRMKLAEATIRWSSSLEKLENTVARAQDTGQLDEPAVTRILTQVRHLREAQQAGTQWLENPTEVIPPPVDHTPTQVVAPPSGHARTVVITPPENTPTVALSPGEQQPFPGEIWSSPATQVLDQPVQTQSMQVLPQSGQRTQALGVRSADPLPLVQGTVLKDRFILDGTIGRGGMGTVFAAQDLRKVEAQDPEPTVAVKVLLPEFAQHPVAFMALQRESRRAQALAHPNVATVFDFDRDGDVVFMTMELLSGQPLDAVIREVKDVGLERGRAMAILSGIAQGLAYAHRKGLVHADLKPGNIFLTEGDVPKVLDFGIARAVPNHALAGKDQFDAGQFGAYTPAYATREMVERADPHTADDVYALGLIAYLLLTGKHPYQRLNAIEAEKRKLRPAPIKGLPRRQWRVIERSLSFQRDVRPVDAGAFVRGLTGITRTQKALIAATAVLALAAGYFGYSRYEATGPAVPFSQLSAAVQGDFTAKMREGNAAWRFYTEQDNDFAWHDALAYYSQAWDLHPRNREAAAALRELARTVLEDHPEQAGDVATELAENSSYLAGYAPVKAKLPASPATR